MTGFDVGARRVASGRGYLDAIATGALGGIEGSVGSSGERPGIDSVVRSHGEAQRDGDALVDARDPQGRNAGADPFGDARSGVDVGSRQPAGG